MTSKIYQRQLFQFDPNERRVTANQFCYLCFCIFSVREIHSKKYGIQKNPSVHREYRNLSMSKFLTNIFGNKTTTPSSSSTNVLRPHVTLASASEEMLETDAAPVNDCNLEENHPSSTTPVLSQPFNSTSDLVGYSGADLNSTSTEVTGLSGGSNTNGMTDIMRCANNENTTNNTMNVHNAQQQLVMQFSNVNQLHFGSVYNFNNNSSQSNPKSASANESSDRLGEPKRLTARKTTSIVAMMQSQEEPDHRMLETIATHLGEGWKLVMRNLGHSEGQIEQAVIDHQMHGGIKEVIYQLLLQWIRNAEDGEATLSRLSTLLWEMNHRECVQRMKLVYKSNVNRQCSS